MKLSMFNFQCSKKTSRIILLFVIFGLLPLGVSAARMNLQSRSAKVEVGKHLVVDVVLNAEGETINAVEGTLVFPGDIFSLSGINDGDSVVNLWIEQPALQEPCVNNICEITFRGVIPGGFEGVLSPFYKGVGPGKLFRVILRAHESNIGLLYLSGGQVYLHDGEGTPTQTTLGTLGFESLPAKEETQKEASDVFAGDTRPPEPFTPEIAQDTTLFNGEYALVFSTQDKGSGIAYYEVQEGSREFVRTKNPYRLQNQKLTSDITVRAVDRAGNIRTETLSAPMAEPLWKNLFFWFAMLVVTVALYWFFRRRIWEHFNKRRKR